MEGVNKFAWDILLIYYSYKIKFHFRVKASVGSVDGVRGAALSTRILALICSGLVGHKWVT